MQVKNINGTAVKFYTISEFAKFCDRKADTIRKMHTKGVLPEAVARTPSVYVKGVKVAGNRLYSEELIKEVAPIIKSIRMGIGVTQEIRQKLRVAFQNEKTRLTSK